MKVLETKLPPPVVTLLVGLAMWLAASVTPAFAVPGAVKTGVALAFVGLGVLVYLAAGVVLLRARTTVDPIHPCNASELVTGGIYRFTRNPIYVGDFLFLLAWAVYLSSPVAVLMTPLLVAYLDRFQIRPEERALSDLFGDEYARYVARARRWV